MMAEKQVFEKNWYTLTNTEFHKVLTEELGATFTTYMVLFGYDTPKSYFFDEDEYPNKNEDDRFNEVMNEICQEFDIYNAAHTTVEYILYSGLKRKLRRFIKTLHLMRKQLQQEQ
ncbi:unnamed protein product, partial [Didymodactylos carnosus]